jgi:hypothetical protein
MLRYLRCAKFSVAKAAKCYRNYCEKRLLYFGPDTGKLRFADHGLEATARLVAAVFIFHQINCSCSASISQGGKWWCTASISQRWQMVAHRLYFTAVANGGTPPLFHSGGKWWCTASISQRWQMVVQEHV